MRPILCYDGYASGGAKAYTLSPFAFTQLGSNVGSVDVGVMVAGNLRTGCIVQFRNTIYVLHNRTIKRMLSDGTWTTVASLSSPYVSADCINQMILCNIGGDYFLVCIYANSSSTSFDTFLSGATYNLQTGVLTTSASFFAHDSGGSSGQPSNQEVCGLTFYNGIVYWFWNNQSGTTILTYNVASPGITLGTTMPNSATNGPWGDMLVWNNELWLVATTTGAAALTLYKLVGSSFVSQATIATTTWAVGFQKPCLFTDGTDLFCLALPNTAAWNLYRITSALAVTNITSSVISGFTGQDVDSRWRFIVDQHQNPTSPEIILMYQGDTSTGSNSFYKWNGVSLPLTFIGSAGSVDFQIAVANPKQGGGEMMFTVGEPHIQIEGALAASTIPGQTTISYRIYESTLFPSGTPAQVKMFFNTDLETPTTRCRLTNPQPGLMLDEYTIGNVTAGSGNLYRVDWRAVADGVNSGQGALLVAQVSGVL